VFFVRGKDNVEIDFEQTKSEFLNNNVNFEDEELFKKCTIKKKINEKSFTEKGNKIKNYGFKYKNDSYYTDENKNENDGDY
jgi:hypothetical protein